MALLVAVLVGLAVAAAVRLLLAYVRFRRLELAIPGPPSLPVLGNTLHFIGVTENTVLSTILKLWGGRHDELSRFSVAGRLIVFVSKPDHLQELFGRKDLLYKDTVPYGLFSGTIRFGLVSLNGELWRIHRRAIQSAFQQRVLDRYTSVFSAEALGFVHRIQPGQAQDVEANLMRLMVRAITLTATTRDVDVADRIVPIAQRLLFFFAQSVACRFVKPWLWPQWAFNLTAMGRNIGRNKAETDEILRHTIIPASRKKMTLQQEREEQGVASAEDEHYHSILDFAFGPGSLFSDDEIMDESYNVAGAATETSVPTLGWVLKTLSLRPDVQERLLLEVQEVLGTDGSMEIATQDLDKLEYMERVVKETMRLLPSIPIIARGVQQQTRFCGHTLPAGTTLIINILGAHRHPGHWPDPLRFDPDRFLPERSQDRHPYAYLPFSAGPRNCVGARYAMMIMKTLLATLVPRYRIDPVDDGFVDPADFPMTFGIASRMVGGVRVVFTPRAESPQQRRLSKT